MSPTLPDRPLRIVVVLPAEALGMRGGTTVQLDRLVQHWRELEHQVEVLAPTDVGTAAVSALLAQLRSTPPDVVHAEIPSALALALAPPLRAQGIPFTTSFHHTFTHAPPDAAPKVLAFLLRFHGLCDLTFLESRRSLQLASALGLQALTCIRRGLDLSRFAPTRRDAALRATWGVADQDPVVLWAGRLIPLKRPLDLVPVWQRIRQRAPRARLVVAGEGPEMAAVQRALPEAICTGGLDQDDLARHYASADLFVHTAPTEPAGGVLLEAAASGLAVVGRAGTYLDELLVPAGAGLLAGSVESLADLAAALAADPAERQRLGAAARQAATTCDIQTCATAWIARWRRLIADRPVA
jgi:glycosyltransferase involved in cell wall biosynthesis